MARYTGPKSRIARRFGEAIFGRTRCCQKETSLPVNMETTEERKLLSMVSC